MKKFLVPAVLAAAVAVTSLLAGPPKTGVAANYDAEIKKIDQQMKKLEADRKAIAAAQQEAEKEIQRKLSFVEMGRAEIARLENEIRATNEKIASLNRQIEEVEHNLHLTVQELIEAQERVETREELLKARLRLMYMKGFVSYLDVLLSSTSFTDFLDRLDALRSILAQDKEILAQNIQDRITIELKKADIEAQLEYVEGLAAQTAELKAELQAKKESKEVAVASYEAEVHELEEITAEEEAKLMQLADEYQKLSKKKRELESKREQEKRQKYTGGQLQWPLEIAGRETSQFGTRTHPITGRKHTHSGLDIAAPAGTAILAAAAGEVVLAQWYGGFGNTVIIEHKEGFRTLYAHIRSGGIKVKVGDWVKAGQKIAEVGSTGSSTGNHLHFGVYVNNVAVDPKPYLTGKK